MKLREATPDDADAIRGLHESAFPESERHLVSRLAVDLLAEASAPPVLSLVSEAGGTLVGHVAFSPVWDRATDQPLGYLLAPLAVSPDFQKRGIGTQLIESGIAQLTALGPGILLVYGDPRYYSRFGFRPDTAAPYLPPYPLQYPFGWQGLALGDASAPASPVDLACVSSLRIPTLW
jgi:putative acetyltransferase